jgi:hypothetical protein
MDILLSQILVHPLEPVGSALKVANITTKANLIIPIQQSVVGTLGRLRLAAIFGFKQHTEMSIKLKPL